MVIGFWKPKDNYGIFSNWAHSEFDMNGNHYKNSEQAFMYEKARLFGDTVKMEKILANGNPMIDRTLGRAVKPYDAKIFDKHKLQIMINVNYQKYSQNFEARKILLSTGDAILVEASPKDHVWGIGMGVDDPDFGDMNKWKGTNLLGQALMEVRKRLKTEGKA